MSNLIKLQDDFSEIKGITLFLAEAAQMLIRTEYSEPEPLETGLSCCFLYLEKRLNSHEQLINDLQPAGKRGRL